MDTETLRQHWPDVLAAVKRERRVAWMLLNSAWVDSLEGGVLTIAFNREGEAKGFATSGHDQVLTGVLGNMLGLNVRVRARVGTPAAPRGRARPAPADPATPGAGPGGRTRSPGASEDPARGQDDPPDGPGSRLGGPGTAPRGARSAPGSHQAAAGGPGGGPGVGSPGGPSAGSPGTEGPGPGAPGAGSPGVGGARRAGPPAASARPAAREIPLPDGPQSAADYDEEWPDDAGPAGAAPGPTGMELIERQLGGTVIEEIEEP